MDADYAAAAMDVALERRLLQGVEEVAGGVEEHDGGKVGEPGGAEDRRVPGRLDGEATASAKVMDGEGLPQGSSDGRSRERR